MEGSSKVWHSANAYKVSAALFALSEVGVLERLGRGPVEACWLASELQLDQEALEPLLELMVVNGVIHKEGKAYDIDARTVAMLSLVALEARLAEIQISPARIVRALRGAPPGDPMVTNAARSLWPMYLRAMQVNAKSLAPHLVRFGGLPRGSRVLDLGGADGSLALALARMVPDLRVTVVDRPVVREAFLQNVSEHALAGGSGHFQFLAADLKEPASLGAAFTHADVVIASNVMHLLSVREREALVSSLRANLGELTRFVVYDQFVSRTTADTANCMVVDWLLCGYRFDCDESEFALWLQSLGFKNVSQKRVPWLPGAMVAAMNE